MRISGQTQAQSGEQPVRSRKGKALLTFSAEGYVEDPVKKLDFLLAHFFEADAGKSYLNPTTTYNIQDIYGRYKNSPDDFVRELRDVLTTYFTTYYPEAEVEVFNKSELIEDPSINVSVVVRIAVWENGKVYSTDKVVNQRQSKFELLVNYHNTGETK